MKVTIESIHKPNYGLNTVNFTSIVNALWG